MKIKFKPTRRSVFSCLSFITPMILSLALCLPADAQTRGAKPANSVTLKLTNPNDSLQYTLGAYLGQWIINNGFTVTNPALFTQGIDDVLLNKNLLVPASQVAVRLDSYQKRLISARSSRQEQLLFQNVRSQSGVGALPSGVNYVVMKSGTGMRPQAADSVLIHVKGFLPDGKLFEDTYAKKTALRGTPTTFIPGLSEALQIMPVGSTWRVFIPSALAYAETGVYGLVPPYSAVIFEVELIKAARSGQN